MKNKILLVLTGLLAPLAGYSAAPEITWSTTSLSPTPGVYYTVRATATDSDGNLATVFVYKNGSPFAFNGGGSGYSNTSDPNGNWDSSGVQIFSAVATDTTGNTSKKIYWFARVGGQPVTVANLPTYPSTSDKLFPNLSDRLANTTVLDDVITDLQSKNGLTMWFQSGIYEFDMSYGRHVATPSEIANGTLGSPTYSVVEQEKLENVGGTLWYNPGQIGDIRDLHNATFKGEAGATLKWASFKTTGAVSQAIAFLKFDSACSAVQITGLKFDTFYPRMSYATTTLTSTGSHLIIGGSHFRVNLNEFWHCPSWAISVGAWWIPGSPKPTNINIDENLIKETWADGIHIRSANAVWIVGNNIQDTGDDAIALINDDFNSNQYYITDFHVLNNYVNGSGWRGIYVANAQGTEAVRAEILENHVLNTARYGIEVRAKDNGTTAAFGDRPIWINVRLNNLENIGSWPHHNTGTTIGGSHGFQFIDCVNFDCTSNTLTGATGDAAHIENALYLWIGNVNSFSWYTGYPSTTNRVTGWGTFTQTTY